jgi:glutamate synthase (NADPH/NADH) large chain
MTGGRVVVLGPTGRNFGAGMSGGIAYVYDEDGTFANRLNDDMVDIDPLEVEDTEFLRSIVTRHHELTGSTVAEGILDRWRVEVRKFQKVMPTDYKRVLEAARIAEEKGLSVDEAIMAAAHG